MEKKLINNLSYASLRIKKCIGLSENARRLPKSLLPIVSVNSSFALVELDSLS